jgi:hypothetical protein
MSPPNSTSDSNPAHDLITLADLNAHGLTVEDVRRSCPHAIEYTDFDGLPVWRAEDLAPLLDGRASP